MPMWTGDDETPETENLTNRRLLLRTYFATVENRGHLKAINGSIERLDIEVYGRRDRQAIGLKEQVQELRAAIKENTDHRHDTSTVLKTIVGIVGVVGIANVIAFITWLAGG